MVDFDALARQARLARSEAAVNQLFFELFALEAWYFLHDPDSIQQPLILELSDGTSLLPGFTDAARAQQWAKQSEFYSPDSESPVMVVAVAQCLMWIRGGGLSADRVSSLCFNLDGENFVLPLAAIEQMAIEILPDRSSEAASSCQWQCTGGITPSFLGPLKSIDELNAAGAVNSPSSSSQPEIELEIESSNQ